MKKHILSLLLIMIGVANSALAQDIMVIEKKDNTTLRINVDDIKRSYFEQKQQEPTISITPSTPSGGTSSTGISDLSTTSVTISAKITIANTTSPYIYGIAVGTNSNVSVSNYFKKETDAGSGNGTITISKSFYGLSSGTTYYYIVFVYYNGNYYYGTAKSFTTTSSTPSPTFTATTNEPSFVGYTTARLSGSFDIKNATKSYDVGFFISTNSVPSSTNTLGTYKTTLSAANYSETLERVVSGLVENTKYYYRAYVLYDGSYHYGSTKSFTTKVSTTTTINATTNDATSIGQTTATLNGSFNIQNASKSYDVGFFISTNSVPTADNALKNYKSTFSDTNYSGNRTASVTGLTAGTKYYFRAYVLYDGEYYYGATKSFTTTNPTPQFTYTVTTKDATNIGQTTATLNAAIVVQNASKSFEIGFFYCTSGTPSASNKIGNPKKTITTSSYDNTPYADLTGLTANKTYYFRAYVLYDGEYYYGATKSFTTTNPTPQFTYTITTKDATNIGQTTATLNAAIVVQNASKSFEIGFFYCTSGTPSASNKIGNPSKTITTSSYNNTPYADLTGLTANKTYYFRAYVLYDGEYHYGATKSFTTKSNATTGTLNGHGWVDLGLPDGTKWATCNVGASTPEGYGDYYAWGETTTKTTYSDYNWVFDNVNINFDIAGTQYDVAHVKWGSTWKMPTLEQTKTLIENCTHVWTTQNGVKGMKFTGPNGNSIFLPAAGHNFAHPIPGGIMGVGDYGRYWLSSSSGDLISVALLYFSSSECYTAYQSGPMGRTIRPVTK